MVHCMSLWEGSKSPRGTERNLFSTDSIHLPEQCHDERLLASSSGAIKQKMWTIPLCNLQNKCCFTLVLLPSLPLFFPLYFQNKNPEIWSPKLRLGNRISPNLFTRIICRLLWHHVKVPHSTIDSMRVHLTKFFRRCASSVWTMTLSKVRGRYLSTHNIFTSSKHTRTHTHTTLCLCLSDLDLMSATGPKCML
jgi:hypothetical protein